MISIPSAFIRALRSKSQLWLKQLDYSTLFLLSNKDTNTTLLALGAEEEISLSASQNPFKALEEFASKHWTFCTLSYDLKNAVEALESHPKNPIDLPDLLAVRPKWVFKLHGGHITLCKSPADNEQLRWEPPKADHKEQISAPVSLRPRVSQERYLKDLQTTLQHIQRGDIYEINYCQEYCAEQADIRPAQVFDKLMRLSQAPHSAYVRWEGKHVLCASPERFFKKEGSAIISQPIKGTAARNPDPKLDREAAEALFNSQKERSENVMIADLVRNDISRIAARASVGVDELFGIYSFRTVHQMITTIRGELRADCGWEKILEALFPMGSMTGAPKVSAMQIIDKLEAGRRGLYSGSIGFVDPDGNADFNVVIRSLLYNANSGYLSASGGGAITIASDPQKEYEESLLKLQLLFDALKPD